MDLEDLFSADDTEYSSRSYSVREYSARSIDLTSAE